MAALTTLWIAEQMRARGYRVVAGTARDVIGGSADSRTTRESELFTAFPGEHVDGNDFVPQALARGAAAVICERAPETIPDTATVVVAPNATVAVGELAAAWLRECKPRVVGITGTVGKTTAKDIVAGTLAAKFKTHKSEGNFNSREGLPLAVMSLDTEHEVSVLEMGMDRPGEILELCEIARPEIGVVLNIGLTHVEKLGSIEAIAREKLSLVRWLAASGTAVINMDDARIAPVASELACRIFGYGKQSRNESSQLLLQYGDVRSMGLAGTRFFASTGRKVARVDSPLPGEHTIPSVMAALGVAMALGMTLFGAANAVRKSGVSGRVRQLPGKNGSIIIDDRYNSSPASLAGALDMLRYLPPRRIALIGKMAELGDFEQDEHRKAGTAAAACCDILVAVGEQCRVLIEAAKAAGHRDARYFDDKTEAAREVAALLQAGDHLLLKASRSQAFETLIPILEGAE